MGVTAEDIVTLMTWIGDVKYVIYVCVSVCVCDCMCSS